MICLLKGQPLERYLKNDYIWLFDSINVMEFSCGNTYINDNEYYLWKSTITYLLRKQRWVLLNIVKQ